MWKKTHRLKKPFLKLPTTFKELRISLNKDKYPAINLYFQDESRFGLMTHTGKCLTAVGVKPVVPYQHKFYSTYLWGSYSPINGDSFVWEVNGTNCAIFEQYLDGLSKHKPEEFKLVVIDNARFHSTKNINVPENIFLVRIPPYCPELNPCEQIWQHLKKLFKNQSFQTIELLKQWLYEQVQGMSSELIKSIVGNHHYLNIFNRSFYS